MRRELKFLCGHCPNLRSADQSNASMPSWHSTPPRQNAGWPACCTKADASSAESVHISIT
jgi:hypothetical protein